MEDYKQARLVQKEVYIRTHKEHSHPPDHTVWSHLLAGIAGGMTTALLTSPLDVLRTRLQARVQTPLHTQRHAGLRNIVAEIVISDGWRGFFRGLAPSIAGVVPATAVKFFTYGNCKKLYSANEYLGKHSLLLHTAAAATAGIVTSTVTNPIWVVKTRLQLDNYKSRDLRQYRNSVDCIIQILRKEGGRGLYRGLSASYLGATETTIHLVLYEQFKKWLASRSETSTNSSMLDVTSAASLSKLIATLIAYPHEVIRTRLRQAPTTDGALRYTGIAQCSRLMYHHEGVRAFYGGLLPHILRSLPSAAISLSVYELVLSLL